MGATLFTFVGCAQSDERLAVALVSPAPNIAATRAAALKTIYDLAKHHDEAGLLAYTPEQASASPSPFPSPTSSSAARDPAVSLALFTIDQKRYAREFVADYPTTSDALAVDYGRAFAAAHVEPAGALFPIHALGALARTGDDDAYRKLLAALPVTDGAIGEGYRAEVRSVIARTAPAASIDAFATLPVSTRLGAVASVDWCRRSPAALLAYRPTPEPASPSPTASAATSVAMTSPAAAPSASPTQSAAPTPTPPSVTDVASLQAAIAHAATVDCGLARANVRPVRRANARARRANPKTRA
jgi:hypothetical protein